MIDKKEHISKLIESLKFFREKPGMLFNNALECKRFLDGMRFMATHVDLVPHEQYKDVYREVAALYGWTWVANSFYLQMVDQGSEDNQIIDNLMKVEIEVWEKLLDMLSEE